MRSVYAAWLALGLIGCTSDPQPGATDATVVGTDVPRDAVVTTDIPPPDAGPDCTALCTAAAHCAYLDMAACQTACTSGGLPPAGDGGVSGTRDVRACLTAAGMACSAARACLRPLPTTPFSAGPYGNTPRDIAGDFTLPTTDGDWNFRSEWTGTDQTVFAVYAPGSLRFGSTDYSTALFQGALEDLLNASPRNVHYVFLWLSDEAGFNTIRDGWIAQFGDLSAADQAWWRPRVHFVTTQGNLLTGWVGDLIRYRSRTMLPYKRYDPLQWAIDSTQHVREVGQLGVLDASGLAPDLTFLAHEPIYYNFEQSREASLAHEDATVVPLFAQRTAHDTIDVDVDLPDPATLANVDTLEVDHTIECPHHRDGECGAWDYLSYLWVCDPASPPDGGVADGGAPADAGGPQWQCNTEIARWITTYWREGRWVTDISGMLPYLRAGGRRHFRWNASGQFDPRSTDYIASLNLRFVRRGAPVRPVQVQALWSGGGLNPMYDGTHPPIHFTVPAGVTRVQLYTLLTGHGGVAPYNCAEFCNHQHHFTVNGHEHLEQFTGAQTQDGCAQRVDQGVVPNQHGTWYYGRGGWCPGGDVAPTVTDITAELVPGTNEIDYTTTFMNAPVSRSLGNIVLSSYLVFSQ